MILTNIFLSLAILLNSINIINFSDKSNKNQLSVEKNDMMSLKISQNIFDLDKNAPTYFLNSNVEEIKCKGLLNKSFENNFEKFFDGLLNKLNFLTEEIKVIENNSQVFTSEYIFHRKNHIRTSVECLIDRINSMSLKEKRKILFYEYRNNSIEKYDGLLGFSLIYNDKNNPSLIGTIVMPDYIGKLEPIITAKSISLFKSSFKNVNDNINAEPLNYFDRYFLTTVGFK